MKLFSRKLLTFLLYMLIFFAENSAQNNYDTSNVYKVKFIRSITSIQDIKSKSFFSKISSLILGEDNLKLQKPISLIAKDSTELIILDQGLNKLVSLNTEKKRFELIETNLTFPSLVAISKFKGNKYLFTDSKNDNIYIYNNGTNSIKPLSDSLWLNKPTGIGFVKSKNEIWVSETGNHSVSVLNESGQLIKRIGKRGVGKAEFNFPTSIWVDKNGKVYIVDALNFRIQIFDYDGNFISMFGEQGDATGYFARPKGIAADSYGNIYIADALFHSIQIFNSKGVYLYSFGTQGREKGKFWLPNGLYIDKNDRIYIADSYNSRIQIFQLIKNSYERK